MRMPLLALMIGLTFSSQCLASSVQATCEFVDLSVSMDPKEVVTLQLSSGSQISEKEFKLSSSRSLTASLIDRSEKMDYSDVQLLIVASRNGVGTTSVQSSNDVQFATGRFSLKCFKN